MSTSSSYYQTALSNTGLSNYSLADILSMIGGTTNVATDESSKLASTIDVTNPTLRTIAEYLSELGAEGYTYEYEDFLNNLNAATDAGLTSTLQGLDESEAEYNRNMATTQATAADTIRSQYAQDIQSGVSKGMQAANLLSTLLGTSQTASDEAQELAASRTQAYSDYATQLLENATSAQTSSNSAYETLMSNIRQLYNDEIQEKTADLEYNASVNETLANYLANKYTADTNYASSQNSTAASAWGTNNSTLASLMNAATSAEAQDNYSAAYQAAAEATAAATKYAADQSYAATLASLAASASSGSSSSGSSSSGTSSSSSSSTKKSTTSSSSSSSSTSKAVTNATSTTRNSKTSSSISRAYY